MKRVLFAMAGLGVSLLPLRGAQEVREITAPDGKAFDGFGTIQAAFGDFLAVGVPGRDLPGKADVGVVYLYERDLGGADAWQLRKTLMASDGLRADNFGSSVAFCHDLLVVGAPGVDVAGQSEQGAVYLFSRHQGGIDEWGQLPRLTAGDGASSDQFGGNVATSGDLISVSAETADIDGKNAQGAVYIFQRSDFDLETWNEIAKIVDPQGVADEQFGSGLAISGRELAVGVGKADIDGRMDQGRVVMFSRGFANPDFWFLVKRITRPDGKERQEFGAVLSLSGETLAVGVTKYDLDQARNLGAVYLYRRNIGGQGAWGEIPDGKLTPMVASANDNFGSSVALSGRTLVVGARSVDVDGKTDLGSVYVFRQDRNDPNLWSELEVFTPMNGVAREEFGSAVALHGGTISVASPDRDVSETVKQGVATIFELPVYELWLREEFGDAVVEDNSLKSSIWGDHADPDGDCFSNLEEAYYGLDPNRSDTALIGHPRLVGLELRHEWQPARDSQGVRVLPYWSLDLQTWYASGSGPAGDLRAVSLVNNWLRLEARLPVPSNKRAFLRILFTR